MAWYEDKNSTLHVAGYKDEKELERELQKAVALGWTIKDTTAGSGHINVGRTMTRAVLTGGIGLMFGASRTKGKILVTWERDPQTVAVLQTREQYMRALGDYEKTSNQLEKESQRVASQLLPSDILPATEAAKKLAEALSTRIEATKKKAVAGNRLIQVAESYRLALEKAGQPVTSVSDMAAVKQELVRLDVLLNSDQQALPLYRQFFEAGKHYGDALRVHSDAVKRVADKTNDLSRSERRLTEAKDAKGRDKAQAELEKHRSELTTLSQAEERARSDVESEAAKIEELKDGLPRVD